MNENTIINWKQVNTDNKSKRWRNTIKLVKTALGKLKVIPNTKNELGERCRESSEIHTEEYYICEYLCEDFLLGQCQD